MPARLPQGNNKSFIRSESFEADYSPHVLAIYYGTFNNYNPIYLECTLSTFKYLRQYLFEKVINGSKILESVLVITQQALKLKEQYPNHRIYLYEE